MDSQPRAHRRLAAAMSQPFNYAEVGASQDLEFPRGYRHDHDTWNLGLGQQRFHEAAQILMSWEMHRRAGLIVTPGSPIAIPDACVVLGVGIGRVRLLAACRVVWTLPLDGANAPREAGFAYGTLTGHPEAGEESFVLRHHDDDSVWLTIAAFSRPATWYAQLGAPATRRVQRSITKRYAAAVQL